MPPESAPLLHSSASLQPSLAPIRVRARARARARARISSLQPSFVPIGARARARARVRGSGRVKVRVRHDNP